MAYNAKSDNYSCDICGFTLAWDSLDDVHGIMWSCEKCGDNFCSKCFTDRFGADEYLKMMWGSDLICCPVCWEKQRQEVR
jgi:ribosomal protein L37AE/L43A